MTDVRLFDIGLFEGARLQNVHRSEEQGSMFIIKNPTTTYLYVAGSS